MAAPRPRTATEPASMFRRSLRQTESVGARSQPVSFTAPQTKGRQIALPPLRSPENYLLQVGHRGQVSRQLDDASRTAPVRTSPAGIDRGDAGRSGSVESAREGIAIALRQVRIGVAQVQREHLVGKANADVPGIVVSIRDAIWESRDGVEGVAGSEPLPPELAGDVHANATGAED